MTNTGPRPGRKGREGGRREDPEPDSSSPSGTHDEEYRSRVLDRVLWRESPEYKRAMRRVYLTVIVCTLLLVGVLVLALVAKPKVQSGESQQLLWITLASAVAIAYGGMGLTLVIVSSARRNFRERRLLGLSESLQEDERELAESGDELDLPSLWAATQKRIDYYHEIATSQAEISFRTGTIASVAGFILLLVVAVLGMFATSAPAAIAVGSVGVAGAAMSAYIGATFLKAQSEASAQLRQFFLQPVEFVRLLGAERLIATLPAEDRADAVKLVVGTMVAPRVKPSRK